MSEPEYQTHVMAQLEDLKQEQRRMNETMTLMRIDIATLKVKSGLWGAGGAVIVGLGAYMAQAAGAI